MSPSEEMDEVEQERRIMLRILAEFTKKRREEGYRLLLVGGKYVTEEELAVWRKELEKAKKAMKQRDEVEERRRCHK